MACFTLTSVYGRFSALQHSVSSYLPVCLPLRPFRYVSTKALQCHAVARQQTSQKQTHQSIACLISCFMRFSYRNRTRRSTPALLTVSRHPQRPYPPPWLLAYLIVGMNFGVPYFQPIPFLSLSLAYLFFWFSSFPPPVGERLMWPEGDGSVMAFSRCGLSKTVYGAYGTTYL